MSNLESNFSDSESSPSFCSQTDWPTWPAAVCRRSVVAAVASGPRAADACAPPESSAAVAGPTTRNGVNKLSDIFMQHGNEWQGHRHYTSPICWDRTLCPSVTFTRLTFRLACFTACSSINCLGAGVAFTLLTWAIENEMISSVS